jgi:hypothetical protein
MSGSTGQTRPCALCGAAFEALPAVALARRARAA